MMDFLVMIGRLIAPAALCAAILVACGVEKTPAAGNSGNDGAVGAGHNFSPDNDREDSPAGSASLFPDTEPGDGGELDERQEHPESDDAPAGGEADALETINDGASEDAGQLSDGGIGESDQGELADGQATGSAGADTGTDDAGGDGAAADDSGPVDGATDGGSTPIVCTRDYLCPAGTYCDSGYCQPGAATCISPASCQPDQVCRNGVCFTPACTTSQQCPAPALCVDYSCRQPLVCATHADCQDAEFCDQGYCVPPLNCTDDSQCRAIEICVSGWCAYHGACAGAADCPAGYVCPAGYCAVPECVDNNDCPLGEICQNNTCLAPPVAQCTVDADCAAGEICSAGVCLVPPSGVSCQGGTCQCSNGLDDDGDGQTDAADPYCTGPYDNDESSFATGIPGDNRDEKKQDCFFDGDSGQGNDGPHGENCLVLTPNGCDCFGCCFIDPDGDGQKEWIRLVNQDGVPCSAQAACQSCTPDPVCVNECLPETEQCFGEAPKPGGCATSADCPAGQYCITGQCILG